MGGQRLLAHRRHRGRPGEDPAGAGRRRRRPAADLPTYREPVAAHPRRPAEEGPPAPTPSTAEPSLPGPLEGALHSLYANYEKAFRALGGDRGDERRPTPPVFIVVCNNTTVSKLVFDYVAGWEKPTLATGDTVGGAGQARRCSPTCDGESRGRPAEHDPGRLRPARVGRGDERRVQADRRRSRSTSSRHEYRQRFPGRDADELTDEDLLREVMNTVGKPGKLGEHVRCVVSVSMLTEGWDANTVTHILGVRAFGTQLLCEQVVGRGPAPRAATSSTTTGHFEPEYAEVYGVPFSFIPAAGRRPRPQAPARSRPGARPRRARRLPRSPSRASSATATRSPTSTSIADVRPPTRALDLVHRDVPTRTERRRRRRRDRGAHASTTSAAMRAQQVAFRLAKRLARPLLPRPPDERRRAGSRASRGCSRSCCASPSAGSTECVTLQGRHVPPAARAWPSSADEAVDTHLPRRSCAAHGGEPRCVPILRPYDPVGSTALRRLRHHQGRSTPRPPTSCHVSHVVRRQRLGAARWPQALEDDARGRGLREERAPRLHHPLHASTASSATYVPDFIARLDDGHGADDLLNLIVEVSGAARRDKEAKVTTARDQWVPGGQQPRRLRPVGASSRSPTRGTPRDGDPRPRSWPSCTAVERERATPQEGTGRPTPVEAIAPRRHRGSTSPPPSSRDFVADDEKRPTTAALPPRPVARPAARRGRARTSRTGRGPRRAGRPRLHPGEDRPAGARREPARHRRGRRATSPSSTSSTTSTASTSSTSSSTSTTTRATGRTG